MLSLHESLLFKTFLFYYFCYLLFFLPVFAKRNVYYNDYAGILKHPEIRLDTGSFLIQSFSNGWSSALLILKIVPCRIPFGKEILSEISVQLVRSEERTAPYT